MSFNSCSPKEIKFAEYDWSSDKLWNKHVIKVLPTPTGHRLDSLKRNWYKIYVDIDFDA